MLQLAPGAAVPVPCFMRTAVRIRAAAADRRVCHGAGVTTQADLQRASPDELPDYVVPSIAALAGLE
jgi:hypothetical protein